MPPASKRYLVVGPNGLPPPNKIPGIHETMQWRSGGRSAPPLPLHMQLPNYLSAAFAYERLQPFLSAAENWRLSPRALVEKLVNYEGFLEVAEELERQGGLIWSVKYGAKPGIYTDTFEALTSVDMSGKSKQGERFQQAYAFRSFRDAVVSQMLNDHPTAAIHNYNPRDNAQESEALRAVLLGIADEPPAKAESPQPPELPHNVPERQSTPPPEPVSAPSTPQRSQSAPSHTENIPGSFNIFFSPNVAVRVNSPGINAPDRSSPVPSTPSRGSQACEGITRGRRTLLAEEFTMDQVLSVEAMLMTCLS
ncbi:hypothetical protein BT96DRAFT_952058, partial [Gymnopus androsaceus JB14]